MRPILLLAATAGCLILAGCGGMSASECELADWRAIGYEDGVQGRGTDRFGQHRRACARHEVAPDFSAYQAGRDAGLREYCHPERGFREGSRGRDYNGVCAGDLEAGFLDAYLEGRTLYELETAVASTARDIEYRESRIKQIEIELAEVMTETLAENVPADRRAALIVQTKQLAEERITLADEVEELEVELREREEALAAHRAQLLTRL